jgi:hypothetical protein
MSRRTPVVLLQQTRMWLLLLLLGIRHGRAWQGRRPGRLGRSRAAHAAAYGHERRASSDAGGWRIEPRRFSGSLGLGAAAENGSGWGRS